ncbi:MAG: regulatory protein GemA [Nitrosomonas sp. PRO4]|nr:regulatory protein GemA [Nitrosomonas sp. PRO4]
MSNANQDAIRRRQLAQIHIAKSDLGLDDDTYRAMLMDVAGVESAAALTAKGRRDVLARFESKGWKNKKHRAPAVTAEKAPYVRKIGAMLADMKLSWNYAHGIAKQMFKKPRVQWCEPEQLRAIVAALSKHQAKLQKPQAFAKSQTEQNA